ncbi:MAG: tRNA (adenosine(37)-N6)-threonylcarbamoyltransferase complex ATPase subunit type 1 TsaE [Cyclobacteriaceae bacterium]
MIKYYIESMADLVEPARKIIDLSETHAIVCFVGEMGAGKTTLIKEICSQLGVEDVTSSPTFSIVNQYLDREGKSVYHFDFFRIKSIGEALDIGTEEYLYSEDRCLIEWPEMIKELIPDEHLEISINLVGDNKRELTISVPD